MAISKEHLPEFLVQIYPFNQFSQAELVLLAEKVIAFRYGIGQPILQQKKTIHQISILEEGNVRKLSYDYCRQKPITLELLKPLRMMGDLNFVRGIACETAIASTEVTCYNLTFQEFSQFLATKPEVFERFKHQVYLEEVFDILNTYATQTAQTNLDLKKLSLQALPSAKIAYLSSGQYDLYESKSSEVIKKIIDNHDYYWFLSGGQINDFLQNQALIFHPEVKYLEVPYAQEARLLGLPKSIFQSEELLTIDQETEIIELNQDHHRENDLNIEEKINQEQLLISPFDPAHNKQNIPYAPLEIIEEDNREEKPLSSYPFLRGKPPVNDAVACLGMIAKYFKIPFRKEVVSRILEEQVKQNRPISVGVCGSIIYELMKLKVQLVQISAQAVSRITQPALIQFNDSFAVIYYSNSQYLIMAIPEQGVIKIPIQEFKEIWGEQGQLLLLETTPETVQERFGLSWFIPYVVKYKVVLMEVLLASFFVQLFALANPLIVQQIIDKVIVKGVGSSLQVFGFLMVFFAVFEAVLNTLRTYLFVDTTNRIDMQLGSIIIDHLIRLPLRYFDRKPVGEISTRINELEKIRQFLTGQVLTVVLDAVFSLIYIGVMFAYNVKLTFVALSTVPIFILITVVFSPIIRRQLRIKAEKNAKTQSHLVEVLGGIQTVKAQNIELHSRWKWQETYADYIDYSFNNVMTSTFASSASNFLNHLSSLLVLWVGTSLVINPDNHFSLGALIAFRIIAGYVTSPLLRLTQLWQNVQEVALSLERLADIVDHPQEGEKDQNNITMPYILGHVKYENICFRFKQGGLLNLNNINLEFPAGTFVGVVGESGAGKSTLTKLISRLYEPESGRIVIDGYDINKVELYSLRRQVGVVPQDPLLFEGTVKENIKLTQPEATDEEMIRAAKIAVADEFIMESLNNGYDSFVGERGSGLSGGQRQRIAIARSILQNPRILVLDEATSALDYATEKQVCANLKEALNHITVFFITHRLKTIQDADVIVMMVDGKVIEMGTHAELMLAKGAYYSLYMQQETNS